MGTCCRTQSTVTRRVFGAIRWIVPGAILALMPKCAACIAAYVMLWTGLSLSIAIAGIVRTSLLVLCIAALAWLAFRRVQSYFKKETQ